MAAADQSKGRGRRERLFIALDLPDKVRDGLAAWGASELVDPALRPVRPESLHLTLVFLGPREAAETEAIAAVMRSVLVPSRPSSVPPAGITRTPAAIWPMSSAAPWASPLLWEMSTMPTMVGLPFH